MKNRKYTYVWCIGTILLAGLAAADLLWGGGLGLMREEAGAQVLLHLRAPRAVTALLAGAALALAGAQMQSVLRNPLADPHIMGVSAGAALGAASATMWSSQHAGSFFASGIPVVISAFIGAMAASAIIFAASKRFRSAGTLLIFGVMLGFIVNALVSILQFSSDAESLKIFYSWSAGSFTYTTWPQIIMISAALVIGFIPAWRGRKGLDIILFGDEYAELSGADTGKIRVSAILSCCILTGIVTAFCGPLGFVGIAAPHIAKGLTGTSLHAKILPLSLLTGAFIGLASDFISRLSVTPLPVASTMALIGIPVILYILLKRS